MITLELLTQLKGRFDKGGRRLPTLGDVSRGTGRRSFLIFACALASEMRALAAYGREADDDPPILRTRTSQFTLLRPIRLVPPLSIPRVDGEASDFGSLRGKVLLVNFWAPWCLPCVEEMPALDHLQGELGGPKFKVVAIAIDRDGRSTIEPFLRERKIRHLTPFFDIADRIAYVDTRNANNAPFALYGLPISYVVDHEGYIRGYITGAVDWRSASAKTLIRHYLRKA